jgi:hypothetical protein
MAKTWLAKNRNRNKRASTVFYYVGLILRGQWHLHHQGVAFDVEGWLRDGQHRLTAILDSGTSVWMLVTINLSEMAVLVLDTQAKRSDADALTLMGVEDVNHKTVAIIKRMFAGKNWSNKDFRMSRDDLIKLALGWREPLMFVRPLWCTSKFSHASVSAVVCKAWFSQDRERLQQFMDVFKSGEMASQDDQAAIRVRDWFRGSAFGGSDADRAVVYKKAMSGVKAFLERRAIDKLYECEKELFPIPDECSAESLGVRQ